MDYQEKVVSLGEEIENKSKTTDNKLNNSEKISVGKKYVNKINANKVNANKLNANKV